MRIEHQGKRPDVHETAYVAPGVVLSGEVVIGPECRILYGAILTADGGPIVLGSRCIVMEQAVLRGTPRQPLSLGDDVLVGPLAYLTGCTVEAGAFLATGVRIFNGATVERDAEVRIDGVVHVNTRVPAGATVPIGWVAVGDPASILPPSDHDRIWAIQRTLRFTPTVFGLPPGASQAQVARRYVHGLGRHLDDVIIEE